MKDDSSVLKICLEIEGKEPLVPSFEDEGIFGVEKIWKSGMFLSEIWMLTSLTPLYEKAQR